MTQFKKPDMLHLLNLDTISADAIFYFIFKAIEFRDRAVDKKQIIPTLTGHVITTLFFEPSTRTLNSFLLAAMRLNALTLAPNLAYSSTLKGESLIDTVQTFEAMGTDLFIVRHNHNHTPDFIAHELQTHARVINAGDGTNQHPTQALLDLMTIYEHKKDFSRLAVAIVGDINHSRVAHSLIVGLHKVGVKDVRLVGPATLTDQVKPIEGMRIFHSLSHGIENCDVIIALRIQEERFTQHEKIDIKEYQKNFCISKEALAHAHPNAIVMHPGPINRNVEISSEVADSTRSVIRLQVKNGVAMRMAILDTLATNR